MIETVMTYSEWEREVSRRNERKKREIKYYLKQKAFGLCAVIAGMITPLVVGDGTISLFIIPAGVYFMLTTKKVII